MGKLELQYFCGYFKPFLSKQEGGKIVAKMLCEKLLQYLNILLWVVSVGITMRCILYKVGFKRNPARFCLLSYLVGVADGNSIIFHAMNK